MRDSFGKNWQIREDNGRTRLGVRFADGSRKYKNLPYLWQRRYVKEITHFVDAVYYLHIKKGVPFMDCLLYTSDAADDASSVDLGGRRIIKKKFFQAEDGIRD